MGVRVAACVGDLLLVVATPTPSVPVVLGAGALVLVVPIAWFTAVQGGASSWVRLLAAQRKGIYTFRPLVAWPGRRWVRKVSAAAGEGVGPCAQRGRVVAIVPEAFGDGDRSRPVLVASG